MKLAVLTSGGDAPGMNAAIRMVAAAALSRGFTAVGVRRGYEGLLDGDTEPLDAARIEGITRFGGTILGSARSERFRTEEGRERAAEGLARLGVDGLVVIGGNGSLTGAHLLTTLSATPIVGIPASIDNDVGHSGMAIGVDTAVNTIVEACDRISDTASAHRRAFIVEVMGRRSGFLAMRAGIAAEADAILFAERHRDEEEIVTRLEEVLRRRFGGNAPGRRMLVVKAEGVPVSTARLVERLTACVEREGLGVEVRESILGHVVRGGNPSALDRMIAQRLAFAAVNALAERRTDRMTAWEPPGAFGEATPDASVRLVPLADVLEETEKLLDGTSEVAERRIRLLAQAEQTLAM